MMYCWKASLCLCIFVAAILLGYVYISQSHSTYTTSKDHEVHSGSVNATKSAPAHNWSNERVPAELLGTAYDENDFSRTISYWDNASNRIGPCFPPTETVDWEAELNASDIVYPPAKKLESVAGLCLPGFLIIGAGKCGTSSLYHYVIDHPRAVAAVEKQIHYFRYHDTMPMQWYLAHFPTTKSFLASGALITGEASPGYLPYPYIAPMVKKRMPGNPKILVVGREPVDRAYSSYRYNYVDPSIQKMRSGRVKGIKGGETDDFYKTKLFTFEEMVQAELVVLRECLAVNGSGVVGAKEKYEKKWARTFQYREAHEMPPLVDLDGFCYGGKVSSSVPRRQWTNLVTQYPDKLINVQNLHLVQSLVGRGLYVLPLEWWYATFPKEYIHFVCTEELSDVSGTGMSKVGDFLGLPSYNFSSVVEKGAYNVGGHKGYDKEVSWDAIHEQSGETGNSAGKAIPLSDEVGKELQAFLDPLNERLFNIIGRRCDW